MADTAWITVADYPTQPNAHDLLAFFGVPPDPESELDENINRKRRFWHKAAQTAPPEGRQRALAVKEAIKEAAAALKRGGDAHGGRSGSTAPAEPVVVRDPKTIDELWQIIQRLIFRQRYGEAVDVAKAGAEKWPEEREPFLAYAWTVQMALAQGGVAVPPSSVDQAIDVLERVMRTTADGRMYRILIGLLQSAGRVDEALRKSYEAEKVLVPFPADMLGLRVALQARSGDIDSAMVTAVAAVHGSPNDDGIRGECVDALLQFAVDEILPVASDEEQRIYGRLVRVAAWCARGVPDLEDRVRLHRLWAANCAQRVFAGNWALRSFVAIVSGFLLLPVYNKVSSRPSWQVLNDGPHTTGRVKRRRLKNVAFYQVASSPHVQEVHRDVSGRFSWTHESGRWPELAKLLED